MPAAALIAPTLDEIRAAANALAPYVIRTPLIKLNDYEGPGEIFLKLENLQPIGAFKARTLGYAMLTADASKLEKGVYTASSGNAGIGLAWMANKLGLAATVYAPDSSPPAKLEVIRSFGATVLLVDYEQWWQIIKTGNHPDSPGLFIDAVRSPAALAGNATIGLEIAEQLPDVDTVFVPFGGGGIACGVSSAFRAINADTRIVAAESDAAAPATAAFKAGRPVPVTMKPSFISGAGGLTVLEEMWPLISELVDDTVVSPVSAVADAVRLLFEKNRVVVEGAGAISVAGALASNSRAGKSVCVVSGGNIDPIVFSKILNRQAV